MNTDTSLRPVVAATAICLAAFLPHAASGQVVFSTDFAAAADYDSNFVKLANNETANILWNSGGYLTKSGTGSRSIIFDTSATGGSGGSGGTSGSLVDNDYTDVSVSSVFRASSLNTASIGLWAHVSDDYTSGYLGLINLLSPTSIQLRIFDSNSNPSTSGAGTVLYNQTFTVSGIAASTNYTGIFSLTNNGTTKVDFSLALYDASGTSLIASIGGSDTTAAVLVGQVGVRGASETLTIDRFSVVPEPSAAAALLVAGAIFFARKRLHRAA